MTIKLLIIKIYFYIFLKYLESLNDETAYTIPKSDMMNAEDMAAFELDVAYKLAEAQNSDSMIVLVSNEENECKEGEYKSNVVRVVMKNNDDTFTGHPYNKARKAVTGITDDLAKRFNELFETSVFDESKTTDKIFMKEMVYMHDMLGAIKAKAENLVKDDNKDFFGIVSDGAKKIYETYGPESEQYKQAQEIVKKAVDTIVKEFQDMYDNGVAEVITTPATVKAAKRNIGRFMKRQQQQQQNATCARYNGYSLFSSEAECNEKTNSCNGRGKCQSNSSRNPGCFSCVCEKVGRTKYGGIKCEAEDISTDFQLLFWSSVMLIAILIFVVGIMFNIKSDIPIVGVVSSHQKTN